MEWRKDLRAVFAAGHRAPGELRPLALAGQHDPDYCALGNADADEVALDEYEIQITQERGRGTCHQYGCTVNAPGPGEIGIEIGSIVVTAWHEQPSRSRTIRSQCERHERTEGKEVGCRPGIRSGEFRGRIRAGHGFKRWPDGAVRASGIDRRHDRDEVKHSPAHFLLLTL